MIIDWLLDELKELTRIEIIEIIDDKSAKIKFLDFEKSKITDYNFNVIRNYDSYLIQALKLNQEYGNKIKTIDGLMSLKDDIREVENKYIELGDDYIDFNLKQGNYDKDPFCKNRLSIYEVAELETAMEEREIKEYKPSLFFNYNKKRIKAPDDLDEIIDEMINEKILLKEANND